MQNTKVTKAEMDQAADKVWDEMVEESQQTPTSEGLRRTHGYVDVYKYTWISDNGFVVYRDIFDHSKCYVNDGVMVHRVASFVCELEAKEYCDHRNYWIGVNGDDDITKICQSI